MEIAIANKQEKIQTLAVKRLLSMKSTNAKWLLASSLCPSHLLEGLRPFYQKRVREIILKGKKGVGASPHTPRKQLNVEGF